MATIKITRSDGGVSIMQTIDDADIGSEIEKWKSVKTGYVSHQEITAAEVPEDRTFRNAWKPDLTVDMPKAREIHKDKLRQLRVRLLEALDIEYAQADERNDNAKKTEIAARREALRNVTADPAIAAAATPEELKNVLPEPLKESNRRNP